MAYGLSGYISRSPSMLHPKDDSTALFSGLSDLLTVALYPELPTHHTVTR
jgi:hypothetical protein